MKAVFQDPATADLLLSALENFPSFVVIDHDGRVVYINENYTKILGITRQEAIGSPVEDVIPNTRLRIVVQSGREEIGEVMRFFDHGAGKEITLVCNRIPILKNGKVIGCIGNTTIKDIDIVSTLYDAIKAIKLENLQYRAKLNTLQRGFNLDDDIVGCSEALLAVKRNIIDYADTGLNMLITGETGVGKELVAQAIHRLSRRSMRNYVKINCAAIPSSLLESELFGYVAGAFTGAVRGGKLGKFELAHNGTLLLDEIGEMDPDLQAKLLRVLQEGEFEPVGSVRARKIDVRILCSTNRDLDALAAQGRFRKDLYYRINAVEIKIPPLRERPEDIEPLCRYIIQRINRKNDGHLFEVDKKLARRFATYGWPGNIRELEHVLERGAVMNRDGVLKEADFEFLWSRMDRDEADSSTIKNDGVQDGVKQRLREAEKQAIIKALEETGGNRTKAAKLLGMDRSWLYCKLHRYNLI
ncbi:MAG: sigma 54-interacting transcriptional regulator [Candidatus Accumulibacter sp.]|jgi:PAS domain S-box-containing protein|nr:sigma 54-interacting transcriptional regulator [Accumulibacter sp.]